MTKSKVVFGGKLKKKKFKTKMLVRDKDIAHFTSYVLQKHTRVIITDRRNGFEIDLYAGHGLGYKVHQVQFWGESQGGKFCS